MNFVVRRMLTGDRAKYLGFAITSVIPVTRRSSRMAGNQTLLRQKRRRFEARP
jgi:hypothetical protein